MVAFYKIDLSATESEWATSNESNDALRRCKELQWIKNFLFASKISFFDILPGFLTMKVSFPALYQVNTRTYLTSLSERLGRKATLDDFRDEDLDLYVANGFEWIWLLSVWRTGAKGMEISRSREEWKHEFTETLPDLKEQDIPGSGFAIAGYNVHEQMGGDDALTRLRTRLTERGLKLMLDFVPNHTAIDHPWVEQHPDYYIEGNEDLVRLQPDNFTRVHTKNGSKVFAYGRDPYFSGWPDTLQLNYGNPSLQDEMIRQLVKISNQCDGVRCDMAMLVLPDVFERTWGKSCQLFWPRATGEVQRKHPGFVFMAEVYWDLEWTLQQQGFSYTYDKKLYDRLKEGRATPVREHFFADSEYQRKSARFLENHDELRAAKAFPDDKHRAAATLTYFSQGLRFFHDGQLEGKVKRISPHLSRGPEENVNQKLADFYKRLLTALKKPIFQSTWKLLNASPINGTDGSYQNYIAFAWEGTKGKKSLVVINYSMERSRCFLNTSFDDLRGSTWNLIDQLSDVRYLRDGNELATQGLYLDEPGWNAYVFLVEKVAD